jgi:hypothetical protein
VLGQRESSNTDPSRPSSSSATNRSAGQQDQLGIIQVKPISTECSHHPLTTATAFASVPEQEESSRKFPSRPPFSTTNNRSIGQQELSTIHVKPISTPISV